MSICSIRIRPRSVIKPVLKTDDNQIIKGAIWHALNHYQFEDALFLAERLFADSKTQEDVFLVATCHYRNGDKWAAKDILETYG